MLSELHTVQVYALIVFEDITFRGFEQTNKTKNAEAYFSQSVDKLFLQNYKEVIGKYNYCGYIQ